MIEIVLKISLNDFKMKTLFRKTNLCIQALI